MVKGGRVCVPLVAPYCHIYIWLWLEHKAWVTPVTRWEVIGDLAQGDSSGRNYTHTHTTQTSMHTHATTQGLNSFLFFSSWRAKLICMYCTKIAQLLMLPVVCMSALSQRLPMSECNNVVTLTDRWSQRCCVSLAWKGGLSAWMCLAWQGWAWGRG